LPRSSEREVIEAEYVLPRQANNLGVCTVAVHHQCMNATASGSIHPLARDRGVRLRTQFLSPSRVSFAASVFARVQRTSVERMLQWAVGKIARCPGLRTSRLLPRELTNAVGQNSDFQNKAVVPSLTLFYGQMGEASCIRVPPVYFDISLFRYLRASPSLSTAICFYTKSCHKCGAYQSMNKASLLGD